MQFPTLGVKQPLQCRRINPKPNRNPIKFKVIQQLRINNSKLIINNYQRKSLMLANKTSASTMIKPMIVAVSKNLSLGLRPVIIS